MQDGNCKKSGQHRVRLSAEKNLPTVIVGLFSLTEKAPTKNDLIVDVNPVSVNFQGVRKKI